MVSPREAMLMLGSNALLVDVRSEVGSLTQLNQL